MSERNSSPTKLHYVLQVPLDRADKRLLDKLVKREKLPRTDVVRRLIRAAAREDEIKVASNG